MARDHYQVLSVERDASEAEIRKAFRVKAKKIHPDHNPDDPGANAKFIALKEAHDLLVDPVTRRKYDRDLIRSGNHSSPHSRRNVGETRRAGAKRSSRNEPRAAPKPRRGPDIERTVRVTLEQVWAGSTQTVVCGDRRHRIHIRGIPADNRIFYPGKGGTGENGGPNGDLHVVVEILRHKRFTRDGDDLIHQMTLDTEFAQRGGEKMVDTLSDKVRMTIVAGTTTGRIYRLASKGLPSFGTDDQFGDLYVHIKVRKPVAVRGLNLERQFRISLREAWAGGERQTTVAGDTISFTVPPGVHDGQRINIAGKGRPGHHGGLPGDLYINIEITSDTKFRRDGDDLYLIEEIVIDLHTALRGGEIEIPTIFGSTKKQIPAGKQNRDSLRLPGLGMPRKTNSDDTGDLIVHLEVRVPARNEWIGISSASEPGPHDTWYWPDLPRKIVEPDALYMKIQYKDASRFGHYDWAVLVNNSDLQYRGRKRQFSGKCFPSQDTDQAKRDAAAQARKEATAALLQRTLIDHNSRNLDDIPFDVGEIPF